VGLVGVVGVVVEVVIKGVKGTGMINRICRTILAVANKSLGPVHIHYLGKWFLLKRFLRKRFLPKDAPNHYPFLLGCLCEMTTIHKTTTIPPIKEGFVRIWMNPNGRKPYWHYQPVKQWTLRTLFDVMGEDFMDTTVLYDHLIQTGSPSIEQMQKRINDNTDMIEYN
jgi:hypothetical protein